MKMSFQDMNLLSMRNVVRSYLALQRFEIMMIVLLPTYLIFESALANGATYAGGHLNFADGGHSWLAFSRGLGFEILTYASSKLCRLLLMRGKNWRGRALALFPGFVGFWCVVVSAGNNFGYVLNGGELDGILASMGQLMPAPVMFVYQAGLGLLLPISVGVLALFDVSHIIHEALEDSDLDNKALEVSESEMHRGIYLKSQEKQKGQIQQAYDEVADNRAKTYIALVKKGDLSFGSKAKDQGGNPGLRRLQGQGQQPQLAAPSVQQMTHVPTQHMNSFPSNAHASAFHGAPSQAQYSGMNGAPSQTQFSGANGAPFSAQGAVSQVPTQNIVVPPAVPGVSHPPVKPRGKLFGN